MKGTLVGFTFNDIHSSELGLVLTSNGSEFVQNLLPSFENKTIEKPGSDGSYYYGMRYGNMSFNINTAFDSLTELQLRRIKQIFGDSKISLLTFDEMPFKSYRVKLDGNPQINYNAFTNNYETDSVRLFHNHDLSQGTSVLPAQKALDKVLKGTITFNFIAYEPFAINRIITENNNKIKLRYSDQFLDKAFVPEWRISQEGGTSQSNVDYNYYNYLEWNNSVNLITSNTTSTTSGITYTIDQPLTTGTLVYNPSDFDVPFNIIFRFSTTGATIKGLAILLDNNTYSLTFNDFKLADDEIGIRINEKLQLIEGIKSDGYTSGRLYNKYLNTGWYFNIPNDSALHLIKYNFNPQSTSLAQNNPVLIDYDYKFY